MKRIVWLLGLICFLNSVLANPVHKQELIGLAQNAIQQKQIHFGQNPDSKIQDYLFVVEQGDTLLLLVDFSEGFVVMSADDAVRPVLAYSVDQKLDLRNIAPAAQDWLNHYAAQVKSAKDHGVDPSDQVRKQWADLRIRNGVKDEAETVVAPLLTALWNQTKYYNAYSPFDEDAPSGYDNRTPNGCVAVAMAMIMYYYRYPSHGQGSHTNYTSYGDFYVNFGQATYFYEAMKDQLTYYNNEVAKLIFHCATAVDMYYTPEGSGANSEDVPGAMSSYFGYNSQSECLSRHDYSLSQWMNMLKTELDAKRPVYYSGCSEEGCHAFVCDGYNSEDYFHFNFGWGGSSNGYYVLRATDDDSVAVGGYDHSQRMIRDLFPPAYNYPSYCSEKEIVCESGTLEDGSGHLDYLNNSDCLYYITEDGAYRFQIILQSFDTQLGHDSLSFWNGHPSQGNLLQTFSGSIAHESTYYYDADTLYITFKTDASVTGAGWRLKYKAARRVNACGSSQTIQQYRGTITDGSGDMQYKSNADCFWRLGMPHATFVEFSFPLMDIAAGDRLIIYDCSVQPKVQLIEFTSSSSATPQMFYSNQFAVEFISDNYLNGEGFEICWSSDYSPETIETFVSEEWQVFPNPASEVVHITMPDALQNAEVFFYDVAGSLVRKCSCSGSSQVRDVDVSSLPNGFYMVVIQDNKMSLKKKMIIQH